MTEITRNFDVSLPENREMLRRFLVDCWNETYPTQVGAAVTTKMIDGLRDESLGGMFPDNDEKVIVALEGGDIVGSCFYATRHATTYIWGFYVRQSAQRSGIGRRMIHLVVRSETTSARLQVTVLRVSADAVEFYKRLGFSVVEESSFELITGYKEKSLLMEAKASDFHSRHQEVSFEDPANP